MEEPSVQRLEELLASTVSFCTDMGTELGISEFMELEAMRLLPAWMQEEPLIDDRGSVRPVKRTTQGFEGHRLCKASAARGLTKLVCFSFTLGGAAVGSRPGFSC
jgi:hypothetical protein